MFNPYEALAARPAISLHFSDLPRKIRGLYHRDKNHSLIVINKTLTQAERRCVLTEELAHESLAHYSDLSHVSYSKHLWLQKQERSALRWAADKLIPDKELAEFLVNNPESEVWEIAEYFWVTEDVVRLKIRQMRSKGELECTTEKL